MELAEFREWYINEKKADAVNSTRYAIEVFIDDAVDILKNDYSLVTEMSQCFFELKNQFGTYSQYKSMRLDAASLDLPSNTLNLLFAEFNDGEIKSITNEFINNKSQLLLNYLENVIKGYFSQGEQTNPAVQLARDIRLNLEYVYKIHLFIVSTDKLSERVKTLSLGEYEYKSRKFKVEMDVLDIEKIYRSKLVGFKKDDIVINCKDFGCDGIPCIKADIQTDKYDSYLAIVPGSFLAEIYKAHSSALLESNVRSFLKFNGSVNKGIRGTILNAKSNFFTYNNGISTTAKSIETVASKDGGLKITSFTDLQIINGGQTTATLAATSIKDNADLSGIYVQMKLTVLKEEDPDLIRYIATYANSQNKVKTADLNSSHPFYVRIEDLSRKIFAPVQSGQVVQQLWFFERARGQYEQPMMQMTTKKQKDDYKLVRPKDKKFTLTDLAKYMNAAEMMPNYVSWGGEVNAAHFHNIMLKQWDKDNSVYNELFYKELIGKKILFAYIENTVSAQEWYQEKRAYRPQIVAYTFSKLALEVKNIRKCINYRQLWDLQKVPDAFEKDVARISKLVFDCIYDPGRSSENIETYCKKADCWDTVSKKEYALSSDIREVLTDPYEINEEQVQAKKEQKFDNGIFNEVDIFKKGSQYWQTAIDKGTSQDVLNYGEVKTLNDVIKYCEGKYMQLTKTQLRDVAKIVQKLKENMIIE